MTPHSVLDDPTVPAFDHHRPLIVFDGECVFCSMFVRFMFRHDRQRIFLFTTAQSPLGQALYRHYRLDHRHFTTNLVIVDGVLHTKLSAFAKAMSILGWPWKAAAALTLLPSGIADPLYDLVARNRYRIFGRYDTCRIPSPEMRDRVIG